MSDQTADNAPNITKGSTAMPSNASAATAAQKLDMEVYAAILGRRPIIDPTLAAKAESERAQAGGGAGPARGRRSISVWNCVARAWDNLMRHAQRQQISDFIRRVSHNASRQIMGNPRRRARGSCARA
jgi:hypothetical protein